MVSLCTAGLIVQVCVLVVHSSHALFSGNMEGKKQKQAKTQAANWAASKQPVPKRFPEWKFKRLVGYSKSHGGKIH